ncbi:hypothetical protein Taro_014038 [Colocasia esculenta]|uniref:Uncharacterized protein n=1 Tax=Colocasia esculenta TaxID=4460 RepID=A0A843UDK3_COLES|nr:hypothetical protein [Colocasia esculenta]
MAFAAPPSFRVTGSSYWSSEHYLGFGPAFACQKKIVTLDVRGSGCLALFYVKESRSAFSLKLHGGNAGSGGRKQNSAIRVELRPTTEEPLVAGEPVAPKAEVSQERGDISLGKNLDSSDTCIPLHHDNGNGNADPFDGSGGNGEFPPGGGRGGGDGGGGGGGDDGDEHSGNNGEEDEFGPLLKFEEVVKETEARGVKLPSDMYEAAKAVGIRKVFLDNYLSLQELGWPLAAAIRWFPLLRNRMLADRQFLFKVGTEIVIDCCCATFAEVKKRGEDFWAEFELYAADLLVGLVVNAERPGCRFSVQQRVGTYFFKGILYGSVGFVCGLIGQGIANMIMTAKRKVKKSEEDIPVPPLVKSAVLWGVFLAVSSNTRYQIINGLERIVESSPLAKHVPPVAMAFTVGVRFANNVYGGMQFVDWARWSGCQLIPHGGCCLLASFCRERIWRRHHARTRAAEVAAWPGECTSRETAAGNHGKVVLAAEVLQKAVG